MRPSVLLIPVLLSSLHLTACFAEDGLSPDEQELAVDDAEAAALDEPADAPMSLAAATAVPATPSLGSEFVTCIGSVAKYLVSFSSSGATSYDVDYRRGSGAWASLYDGSLTVANFTTSNSTTSVTFRARACNSAGCSAFRTNPSFFPQACAGGSSL